MVLFFIVAGRIGAAVGLLLDVEVAHRAAARGQRRAEALEHRERGLGVRGIAEPVGREVQQRRALGVAHQHGGEEQRLRRGRRVLEVAVEHAADRGAAIGDDAGRDRKFMGVPSELERDADAENAAAAQRPEEIGVLAGVRGQLATFGADELHFAQVVDRQTVPALQAPHAAAERQPADTGMRDDTEGGRETGGLGRGIEVAEPA